MMQVKVRPRIPTVIRLRDQKSPISGKYNDIVIDTVWGLAFTRHQILNNDKQIAKLVKKVRIKGGKGTKDFIVPTFSDEITEEGDEVIQKYALTKVKNARNSSVHLMKVAEHLIRRLAYFWDSLEHNHILPTINNML